MTLTPASPSPPLVALASQVVRFNSSIGLAPAALRGGVRLRPLLYFL